MTDPRRKTAKSAPRSAGSESEARRLILEAAFQCAVRFGWTRTRMSDVAARAGLSRQTLYRHFQTKEGLAAMLALREQDAFLDEVREAFRLERTIGDAVVATVTLSLKRAESHPLLRQVFEDPNSGLLPYVTTRALPLMTRAKALTAQLLVEMDPTIDPGTVDLLADVLTREIFSHTLTPSEPIDVVAERLGRLTALVLRERPSLPKGARSERSPKEALRPGRADL
jgi:AcrR family transcriptional regulator